MEQEAYDTSLHIPSDFCNSTAPKLYEDASAEILVMAKGSYKARTVWEESSSLILSNALCCAGPPQARYSRTGKTKKMAAAWKRL